MELYFSGVASRTEYDWLMRAGVESILVDQYDLKNIPDEHRPVALDTGAYKISKSKGKLTLDVDSYVELARSRGPFSRVFAPDVIGDPARTKEHWLAVKGRGVEFTPVYHWQAADPDLLRYYLDESQYVAIGGLVKLMREGKTPEQKRARQQMLEQLAEIAARYPQRLHIFGICWVKAIEELNDLVASSDTSKWLDGGRYRFIIFRNLINNHLSIAPQRAIKVKDVPIYAHLDRAGLNITNARNMQAFVKGRPDPEVLPASPIELRAAA